MDNQGFIYETETKKGDIILLKLLEEKDMDSAAYKKWFYDPEVTKYNRHGLFPYTEEKRKSIVENISKENVLVFGVYLQNQDNIKIYIGDISLQSFNWIYRSAEIAWVLGNKAYWGRGIAEVAGNKVLEHGFNRLNFNRIWSGTGSVNKQMQRVFDKLKFQQEGVFREGMFLDGEYIDIWLYSILKKEWRKFNDTNNKSK